MRIKTALILLASLLASCASMDKDLESAIAYGKITELNEYAENIDTQLFVRLFGSPIHKGTCFRETHGVCGYRYFLSVSTYDEYPETAIFRLNQTGEITQIQWLESSMVDTAIIEFKIAKYTNKSLLNNPDLINETHLLQVHVKPDSIRESLTPLSN